MIRGKIKTGMLIACILIAASAVIVTDALSKTRSVKDTERAAARTGKALAERMALLKDWSDRALSAGPDEWIGNLDIPEDMVIYRYVDDSLTSCCFCCYYCLPLVLAAGRCSCARRHRFPLAHNRKRMAVWNRSVVTIQIGRASCRERV